MGKFRFTALLSAFFSVTALGARDPTMPMTGAYGVHEAGNETAVSMILVSEQRRLAVVGGNFVHVGDTIGKNRVIAITPDSVTLQNTETGELTTNQVIVTDVKQYAP